MIQAHDRQPLPEPGLAQPVPHPALSWIEELAAKVTLKDIDLLRSGPARERLEAVHDLVFISVVGVLQLTLWTLVLAMFGIFVPISLAVGLLIAAVVVLIDIRMIASDTYPRGVLRNGPYKRSFWGALGARLLISLVLSNVTAVGVDLAFFRQEAIETMEADRDRRNQPIVANYERRIVATRDRELGPLQVELKMLISRRAAAAVAQTRARTEIENAYSEAQAAELENDRQIQGLLEREEGNGPLAKDAEKRRELAEERMDRLSESRQELATEDEALGREIASVEARMARVGARVDAEIEQLRDERNDRLAQATNGPLTVVIGMLRLRSDPLYGPAIDLVSLLAWSGIMVLELGYFLSRSLFRSASVHDVGVNTDAQRRAAIMAHGFADDIRGMRQRQPLRVVDTDDAPHREGQADA